jgi:hypothetical protein
MRVLTKMLAGGAAAAALFAAAPAAAQYYPGNPGYGYPAQPGYGYPGGGYGGYGGYGYDSQALISQCTAAVQQRLNGGYGGYGYGNPYGGYGGGRVLGVSRVEPRQGGGVTVRGVAASGRYGGYGYGYAGQQRPDLVWKCRTDYRGFVVDIDVERAQRNYGYDNYTPYNSGYDYDYSQYGYRRY